MPQQPAAALEFNQVFERLRSALKPLEPHLKLKADEPGHYNLYSHQVRADGYEYAFAAVVIKKQYVSYHFFPLYVYPDLLSTVSEALQKRMGGKTCFNFKRVDEALLSELEALTRRGFERVQAQGY